MEQVINDLIEKRINPALAQHQGAMELVKLEQNIAHIKLTGGCDGCPGRKNTFMRSIKPFLLANVENLKEVILDA